MREWLETYKIEVIWFIVGGFSTLIAVTVVSNLSTVPK